MTQWELRPGPRGSRPACQLPGQGIEVAATRRTANLGGLRATSDSGPVISRGALDRGTWPSGMVRTHGWAELTGEAGASRRRWAGRLLGDALSLSEAWVAAGSDQRYGDLVRDSLGCCWTRRAYCLLGRRCARRAGASTRVSIRTGAQPRLTPAPTPGTDPWRHNVPVEDLFAGAGRGDLLTILKLGPLTI